MNNFKLKKTFVCLLFFVTTAVSMPAFTQVTVSVTNTTIKQVLRQVEKSSGYSFFYSDDALDLNRRITVNIKNEGIEPALNKIFAGTNVHYAIGQDKQIMLMAEKTDSDEKTAFQPEKKYSGTITDDNGEPVIGASVTVKGIQNGTVTDVDGKFSIEAPAGSILLASYIGYRMQEVKLGASVNLQIIMQEDDKQLNEVVVVGYGTQKKATLTGAVEALGNNEITTTKTGNVQNALSGKIAGLKIYQKTSEPGTFDNNFSIRGFGAPLVVIDGVPRDNFVRLDANEIESISVLKDASASIYGVRASNGVILITTKKGERNSKFQFNYTGYYGRQYLIRPAQTLDAIGWMTLQNEQALNGGEPTVRYPKEAFEPYLNGEKQSTDWLQEVRDYAPQTYHNISAQGGTDKLDYFVGFGYNNESGIWKSGDLNYQRYNLRSNVTAHLAHGLKAEVLLNLMTDLKKYPGSGIDLYSNFFTQIPINPYSYTDEETGSIYYAQAANGMHPYIRTHSDLADNNKTSTYLAQTNLALEWEIPWVKGLKARGAYSYDYTSIGSSRFHKAYFLYDYTDGEYIPILNKAPSSLNRETIQYINTLLQASLNYAGKWNDKHSLSALLLYEESNRKADNFYGRREFSLDAVEQLFAGNTTNQVINSNPDYLFDKANKSLVGRLNYDYASKYLAEFSFRYDGSSLYGPGHQWGFFPSGLVGWRMSEEAFIKNNEKLNFINNLKWRVSYGVMGDENAAMYQYLAGYTYPNSGYVFGTDYINALSSASGANPALSWSKSSIFNAGLDIGLWNGLLGLSADIFQRYRYDLVGQRNATMPNIVGIDLPQENLNSEIIKGVEFVLTHRNKIGNDFTYHFSGNIAFSRSKTDYYERQRSGNSYLDWRGNPNGRWNSIVWGRDYLGQYQSFDEIFNSGVIYEGAKGNSRLFPGDLIYGDWNEDGIIDGNDDHPIALNNADNPLLTYGFTIGVKYRGFDLNTVWQGTGMRWIRYPLWYTIPMEWGRGGLDIFLDRWHRADEFNPDSEWIPGYYPSTYVNNLRGHITQPNSQFWQLNCSYLRLKSLELGYTLPAKITKKTGMENVRLFFNSYNLLTFTKMKFIDPERPDTDLGSAYPNSKTFNIGANVTF